MKALLVILTICLSYFLCQGTKVSEKPYPKKYKTYNNGKILINPGKYEKARKPPQEVKKTEDKSYTAFQHVGTNAQVVNSGVPDSPYFPIDHAEAFDQKSRVKKVLPEYPYSFLRQKRSADVVVPAAANDEKKIVAAEVEKVTTPLQTSPATELTAVKTPSTPKEVKEELQGTTAKSGSKRSGVIKPKKGPARKGKAKPKAKAAPKKNAGRVNRKPKAKAKAKPKGKNAAARAKPKAKRPETRRLTAAREALIEDYPYMVSIQKDEQHWCSGALLNPRLVITTANCLWKANRVSRMEVRTGSRHTNRGGQMAGIQEVMKHPNWGLRKSPDNDVALLLLNKNIRFSDSVHGVDLPNRVMMPPFDDAWITSWGAERRDGVYVPEEATTLQVFHARLIDREKCNNVTMRFSVIVSENFICLAQSGRQAPCTRDTGAPAVSDGVLWGLASWGIRKLCGTERYPAVFSYLASHSNMDFIMNATHYLMSDKRQYPFADRYPGSLMENAKIE